MAQIKAQYQVTEVPDTVIRKEVVMESQRDKDGKHIGFKAIVREKRGGYFYSFPNGNSITLDKPPTKGAATALVEDLSNLNEGDEVPMDKRVAKTQLEMFGLTDRPKLVDLMTGEEVDERGVPLSLSQYVVGAVAPADMPLEFRGKPDVGSNGVESSLAALEE